MSSHQHHHITLAESDFGTTVVCTDCGSFTVNLPNISLRIDGPAFHALHALLQQAQANLNRLSIAHPEHPAFGSGHASSARSVKRHMH